MLDNTISKASRLLSMTQQSAGCGLLQFPNYFQLQLSAAKLQNAIHHWCFNYWCSPVTGPLCTLIIHHKFLPVSSLSLHLYSLQMSSQDAACLFPLILTVSHYSSQWSWSVSSDKTALYLSPVRSISGADMNVDNAFASLLKWKDTQMKAKIMHFSSSMTWNSPSWFCFYNQNCWS